MIDPTSSSAPTVEKQEPIIFPSPSKAPSAATPSALPKTCDTCIRGGFPLKKEILSFVVVAMIGLSTVLFVLLINEKRKTLTASSQAAPSVTQTKTEVKKWSLPEQKSITEFISLPAPELKGKESVEAAIATRRSRRTFATTALSLKDLSQLLWSAQGITDPKTGYRTAPSGMSGFPFTVYVVVRNVTGLNPGLYQYIPEKNQLGNLNIANAGDLLTAAGVQAGAQQSPVVFLLSAAPAKTAAKLKTAGADPMTDVLLEAGHIGQNMYLQAESLNLAMVVMGGFDAKKVGTAMKLDVNEETVYIVPVGNRAPDVAASTAPASKSATPAAVKPVE